MKLPPDFTFSYNRKSNDFAIESTLVAGIKLVGREVKSVVAKEVDLTGSYILVRDGALLVGCYIKSVTDAFSVGYEATRDRTLLLNKSELNFLKERTMKGFSLVPIKIFQSRTGKVKLLFGIGRPLKKWDRRNVEKEKEDKKEMRNYE